MKNHDVVFLELFGRDILKLDYKYIATVLSFFEQFVYTPISKNHTRNYLYTEKKDYKEFLKKFKRYSFSYEYDDFRNTFTFNFTYTWYRGKKLLDLTVSQCEQYFIVNIKGHISHFIKGYSINFPNNSSVMTYLHNYYGWDTYKNKNYQFDLYYDFNKNGYESNYGLNAYLAVDNFIVPLKETIASDGIEFQVEYFYDIDSNQLLKIKYSSYINYKLYFKVTHVLESDSYQASSATSDYFNNVSGAVVVYIKESSKSIIDLNIEDFKTIEILDY